MTAATPASGDEQRPGDVLHQHPRWSDGSPMLVGQLASCDASEANEPPPREVVTGRIVTVWAEEITVWYDDDGKDCSEVVLPPDSFWQPDGTVPSPVAPVPSDDEERWVMEQALLDFAEEDEERAADQEHSGDAGGAAACRRQGAIARALIARLHAPVPSADGPAGLVVAIEEAANEKIVALCMADDRWWRSDESGRYYVGPTIAGDGSIDWPELPDVVQVPRAEWEALRAAVKFWETCDRDKQRGAMGDTALAGVRLLAAADRLAGHATAGAPSDLVTGDQG